MKRFKSIIPIAAVILLVTTMLSSCVKKDYDEPETANMNPNLTVTHSLSQIIALYGTSVVPHLIDSDFVISGIVIADDSSGNMYKEIIIQDSTAGLSVLIDLSNYYTNYPIGRRIYIHCKGLYVANDGDDNYQIGFLSNNAVSRIPASLLGQYIVKGEWGRYVEPTPTTITEISSLWNSNIKTNTLILLSDVEFKYGSNNLPYADAVNLVSKNLTIEDCSSTSSSPVEVVLYTSGYAKFANQRTPNGKGTVVAVVKLYNNRPELVIRDTRDVNMPSLRCDGSSGNLTFMTIDSLRTLFNSGSTSGPTSKKIKGIVISDQDNTTYRNCVIQDSTAGITVRFSSAHSFALGDEIEVNVTGAGLSEYNGLLELNVSNGYGSKIGTGSVTPRIATILDIANNFEQWESTLVTIQTATITGTTGLYSGTSGSNTLTDATGTMILYTLSSASFSTSAFPIVPVNITGVLSEYTTSTFNPQLSIRTLADVQ